MKLRLSLRLYMLGTLLFLVVSLAAVYSVLTVQYFVEGIDMATRRNMNDVASTVVLDETGRGELLGYQVVDSPDKLPEEIKINMPSLPTGHLELYKEVIQDSMFSHPKAAYFVMRVENQPGEVRYVARSINKEKQKKPPSVRKFHPIAGAVFFGFIAITVFFALLLLIMRSIANPVEQLRDWAKSLNPDSLRKPAPDFRYKELNSLAAIIHSSLQSVHQALDREHDFLRHASHELRTPIATISSNLELLKKLTPNPTPKEARVRERIERSSATMKNLTETLLWLSRDLDESLTETPVRLDQLIEQTSQDLNYLLEGKAVNLHLKTSPVSLKLPPVATQILLTNLIRNAFQHTNAGEVWIEQQEDRVSIINQNNSPESSEPLELGFGLGLNLSQKLAERFNWHYTNQATLYGHKAGVQFCKRTQKNKPS